MDGNFDLPENCDLLWDLNGFTDQPMAVAFFRRVCSAFCLYSPAVEQLYTNYQVCWSDGQQGLALRPDPHAFHDTFSFVSREALSPTGILVLPGTDGSDSDSLMISLPVKQSSGRRLLEVAAATELLENKYRHHNRWFLPVLTRGDLREDHCGKPYLHLHTLNDQLLPHFSSHDRSSLREVIGERFSSLSEHVAV